MVKDKKFKDLKSFLEEKRDEQIENANKVEMLLKDVFDKLGIDYDYQHIEIIKDDEGKEHGYIYDFLVDINGNKYDVEVDGSSHDDKEEQDKERDELSNKIGIKPIRFSTQMVYTISYEVSKGIMSKRSLVDIIKLNACSINEIIDAVEYFSTKCSRYEFMNKSRVRQVTEELLDNDEDNKYIDSIKDVLNDNVFGEHGEVAVAGKIIPTTTCRPPHTTVTCGTNGYKGGDWSHGSRTYVKIEGNRRIPYYIRRLDEYMDGSCGGIEIVTGGDKELDSLIETFRTVTDTLENMKNEIIKQKVKGIASKLNYFEKKEMVEMLNNEFEEDSLFDTKERHRKVGEEMARECFLLSKNDVGKVSE